jgi:hypothetical protein
VIERFIKKITGQVEWKESTVRMHLDGKEVVYLQEEELWGAQNLWCRDKYSQQGGQAP